MGALERARGRPREVAEPVLRHRGAQNPVFHVVETELGSGDPEALPAEEPPLGLVELGLPGEVADPDATVGDAYDQPVRFGFLGDWSDFIGRMPAVVILDRRGAEPTVATVHRGRSTFDRPSIEELLADLDRLRSEPSSETDAA